MEQKKKNVPVRCLAEGGISVALAIGLSYLKIPIGAGFGGFGGSIDLVMIPLIVFAARWGLGWGLGVGLVFGTLKYFFANGLAVSWVSIIFDYSVAYAFVGFAGLLRNYAVINIRKVDADVTLTRADLEKWKYRMLPVAALIGCVARFLIHFLSGITVYAEYLPEEFMGISGISLPFWSFLYNGTYMLPNTILAVVVCALLIPAVQRLDRR